MIAAGQQMHKTQYTNTDREKKSLFYSIFTMIRKFVAPNGAYLIDSFIIVFS